jgi:ABC-type oligopeptide transport system ATPase subunit
VYIALSKQNDEQAATLIKLNNSSWGKIIYEETDYTMLIIESMDEIKEDMDIAFNDVEYITLT